MTGRIEPALSAEEWEAGTFSSRNENPQLVTVERELHMLRVHDARTTDRGKQTTFVTPREFAALIALANAALPDSEPRKITRAWVEFLRQQAVGADASDYRGSDAVDFNDIADALESYLPPE